MTTCKNCNQAFEGNYCPDCGQKASTKRFSTKILFAELVDKIFPLDRGVLYTGYQLAIKPGRMLEVYLDGKRAKYTKPLQFLMIMIAVSLIFFPQEDFQRGVQAGYSGSDGPQEAAAQALPQEMFDWIGANMTVLIAGIIPFIALAAHWLFRKRGLNYAEYIVITCYQVGGATLLSMPIMLVTKLTGTNGYSPMISSIVGVIFVTYMVWGYGQLFKTYNIWITGLKSVIVVLLGYLLYTLLALLLISIVVILKAIQ